MRLIMILTMMFSFAATTYAGTKAHKSTTKTKSTKVAKHKKPKKKEMTATERKALAKKQVEKARREVAARKAKELKLPEKIYPSVDDHSDTDAYLAHVATTTEENTERDIANTEETIDVSGAGESDGFDD